MRTLGHLGALAACLVALLAPATALAHADLTTVERATTGPASERLRLVFSSPIESAFLATTVRDASGRRVAARVTRDPRDPRAAIVRVTGAPPGRPITLRWRILSQDGHPRRGEVAPGATRSRVLVDDHGPAAVLARLLTLAGPIVVLGLVVLMGAVIGPALDGADAEVAGAVGRALSRWWTAWLAAALLWAVGLILLPAAVLRDLGSGAGDLGTLILDTRFGAAWMIEAGALVAAVVAARMAGPRALRDRRAAAAVAVPPAIALGAISWLGHASTGGDAVPNQVIDAVHNLATAAWLGGLAGLAVLLLPALASLEARRRVALGAAVVVRFSALALAAVVVLVVTGVYRALAEVPHVGAIADSAYGVALLVKLGIFVVLLAVGGYNRLVVHPRLERSALELDPLDRGLAAARALRVSLRAELVLAAAVLASVAVLISLAPPA